jgi:hypothetical protein
LAALTLRGEDKVVVLGLQSGDVRLAIDAGMRIMCVGLNESIIVVAGEEKIVTWNIPAGDCAIDCTVNTSNSVQTAMFAHPPSADDPPETPFSGSVSPGLNYVVVLRYSSGIERLEIYDTVTGAHLTAAEVYKGMKPWFVPGGCEIWVSDVDSQGWKIVQGGSYILKLQRPGWRIVQGDRPDTITLEPLEEAERHPREFTGAESPCGYEVTDGGWVVNPTKERILWLPHHWRSAGKWGKRFIGLQQAGRPDIIILELLK